MSAVAKMVMRRFYQSAAGDRARLPWNRDEPDGVLVAAAADLNARRPRGRALDLGCGAGVFSVWLAKQGFDTTGIDLFPEAIGMARSAAASANVSVDLIAGDLFTYAPAAPFDLVFDSGCLHSLVGGNVASYKQQLLRLLGPGGSYVLEHWGKRHAVDWRPIGPKRRSEAAVRRIFEPELRLRNTQGHDFATPLPFGPVVRGVAYWFERPATGVEGS